VLLAPVQAPNANAFAERWVGTVRAECLDWLLIVGRGHLEQILRIYVEHYNAHRPHRGSDWRRRIHPPVWTSSVKVTDAGCTDVTCLAVCSTSTGELHERISAPHALHLDLRLGPSCPASNKGAAHLSQVPR